MTAVGTPPLRLAVVGSGRIARVHMNHWRAMPDVRLVAVASQDVASARALAGGEGSAAAVAVYASLDELLDAEGDGVDMIDICAPTPAHKAAALAALAAGRSALVEKPLARSVADCDAVIAAAAQHPEAVMMVGHTVRYFAAYEAAHDAVVAGRVGAPAVARTARLGAHPQGAWNNWYSDPALSGGVVMDLTVHDFDWLLWTLGPVERVTARGLFGRPEAMGRMDYALCTLRHASGALSHVAGSWAHAGPLRATLEVAGDAGLLEYDSAATQPLAIASRAEGAPASPALESPLAPSADPYYRELRHFADCVRHKRAPEITLADARAAVAVAEAALRSIATGEPARVEDIG